MKWNWSSVLAFWFTISECYNACVCASLTVHACMCVSMWLCMCVWQCVFFKYVALLVDSLACAYQTVWDCVAFQPDCNSLEHLSVNHICMPKGSHAFWKSNGKILDWLTHRDRAHENYQFRFRRSHFFTQWLHMLMLPGPLIQIQRNKMHIAQQWLAEQWLSILFSAETVVCFCFNWKLK